MEKRRESRRNVLRKRLLALLIFTILGLTIAIIVISTLTEKAQFSKTNGKPLTISLDKETSPFDLAGVLKERKVVPNTLFFQVFLAMRGEDFKVKPGIYRFKEKMSYSKVIEILKKGPEKQIKAYWVTLPEGFTIPEIAKRLGVKTKLDTKKFLELAAQKRNLFNYEFLESNSTSSLEGYLFPKTYRLDEGADAEEVIRIMLDQFQKEINSLDWTRASARNLSLHQTITIASLIEREARVPQERPLISAVIHNRLKKKMKLEIDATVRYALSKWEGSLTASELKVDSAYNTRRYPGLPPGPISNPGFDSIKAALYPAKVDYLYYVLTDTEKGIHTFTSNYDEFVAAKKSAAEKAEKKN